LAALIFVTLDDLIPLDFVARLRVMRPQRDPGRGYNLLRRFWRRRAACLLRRRANVPLRFLIVLFRFINRLRAGP
jgi:hypothetical protein